MANLDVNHFKNELSDYYYLKSKIAKIEDLILELDVKRGVRAVRYDKEVVQGATDQLILEQRKLDDIEYAERLENEHQRYLNKLEHITNFLKQSSIGDSIMRIHCTGESTYEKESKRLFMGEKTLKRKVNREIIEFLQKEAL